MGNYTDDTPDRRDQLYLERGLPVATPRLLCYPIANTRTLREDPANIMEAPTRKAVRPPIATELPKMSKPPLSAPVKKQVPPDQTYAENFYYLKQMQGKTPMVIVLQDGEQINGVIEWYDRTCLKVNREDGPNLMLFKSCIKYMYKAE